MRHIQGLPISLFNVNPQEAFADVYRTCFYAVDIAPDVLNIDGRVINHIILLTVFRQPGADISVSVSTDYLILRYNEQPSFAYLIANYKACRDRVAYLPLIDDMKRLGGSMTSSHMRTKLAHSVWSRKSISDYYSSAVSAFYQTARQKIRCDHSEAVAVVSIGCGEGDDLHEYCQGVDPSGRLGYGLDMQSKNIETATQKYPQYHFDTFTYDTVHNELCDRLECIKQDVLAKSSSEHAIPLIIICIGFVARSVLDGTWPAARFLQQLYVSGADEVHITSLTESLVYTDLMQASGFSCQSRQITGSGITLFNDINGFYYRDPFHFYYHRRLTRLPFLNYVDAISARSAQRSLAQHLIRESLSILDLSLTAQPCKLLDYFLHTDSRCTVRVIDLSWSYIRNDEISELIDRVKQFSNLQAVYVSVQEQSNPILLRALQGCNIEIMLRQAPGGNLETDSFAPWMHDMTNYKLMKVRRVEKMPSVARSSVVLMPTLISEMQPDEDGCFDPYKLWAEC